VDQAPLNYLEYLPAGYDPQVAYPVAILLHARGGNMRNFDTPAWRSAADTRGYILASAQGRLMPCGLYDTYYFDGPLGPGEQDIVDIIDAVAARHLVDRNRVYLTGFSMGGIGSLGVATRRPGIFAASAPAAPFSDGFQQWDYLEHGFPNCSTASVVGGLYGQTPYTDTNWYMISPRFFMLNLMNTPLRFVHGTQDTAIPNSTSTWPYMQSRHVVDTPGYVDSRGGTLTLQQLQAAWPGKYYEEHQWPQTGHVGSILVPTDTLAFFDQHTLITDPLSVAFSTYEDHHTRAYWLKMDLFQPWTTRPGVAYAVRDPGANSVQLQVTGSMTITLDMPAMGLTSDIGLSVNVQPVSGVAPAGELALVLSGTWPVAPGLVYTVTQDGVALPPGQYTVEPQRFTLLRRTVDASHTYLITHDQAGPTPTSTPTPLTTTTFTATRTPTPTGTASPNRQLRGHVIWQGRPAQPHFSQQLPVSLTLKLGALEVNYPPVTTDANGYFTVTVNSLAPGTYSWRSRGQRFLANAGVVVLSSAPLTNLEVGLLRTGDIDDNNVVNTTDFNAMRNTYGKTIGDPGFDPRADFNADRTVNITDFNLLKLNFGSGGAPPILPGGR
jgi:hypothetical protein